MDDIVFDAVSFVADLPTLAGGTPVALVFGEAVVECPAGTGSPLESIAVY